ncbi:hypothetical protein [uncultured Fibrella sp.]|uniref:hypothetical protein n=1 Tax=uncultured Fibrella sp. TaxID=1284596 RepID=UPI0035CA4804
MTTSLSYLIMNLGRYSRIASVGVAAYRYSYLLGPVRLFAALETVGLVIVLYSQWLSKSNNTYLFFIETGIDAVVMSLMYAPLMPSLAWKRVAWAFAPVMLLVLLADWLWYEGLQQQGNSYVAALECAGAIVLLTVYLNSLLASDRVASLRRHPMFVISLCLLLISLIAIPLYLFLPALMSYSMTLTLRAYDLMFLSAFLAHTGYAYAFWITKAHTSLASKRVAQATSV